jgi:hypothetical protein
VTEDEFLDEAWPVFEERFGAGLGTEHLTTIRRTCDRLRAMPQLVAGHRETLLHGDAKLDNMFFDGDAVTLFDWGSVMRGPPEFDVALFLALDFDPERRRRMEDSLLAAYFEALSAAGVEGYGPTECRDEYRRQLAAIVPRMVCAGGLAAMPDESMQSTYLIELQRVTTALEDHRWLEISDLGRTR